MAPMAPPLEVGGPPHSGIQIQGRLATQLGLTSLISPGFSVGYRTGNLVFAGQLGVTAGKVEDGDTTDSFSVVQLVPMVYWDLWQSRDGKARMNLVGGLGVGKAKITSESGGMTDETTADFALILGGLGGDYWMHKNFALGVEVGIELPVLNKIENNGTDTGTKAATQSIHGLFRFTFVTGD